MSKKLPTKKDNCDPEIYFKLLDLFFEKDKQNSVKHHIDSFNQLIEEVIPLILQDENDLISEQLINNN
ncbi:intein-containing DNA-directed RNA polymerase subunit 2 [Cotonvirus japonicus]|uniref:Intein-containing DNA-directed RNA polymerase subunit 2 n=1 Tax=Cotonvirus japonicus TaxID=2811091 RepID=A0ABM7NS67_9VIRU|nr:intein-containing DNA-directed RNA polymerase subunit 2 [Cotonvirus japonicus]BCS82999.1 intein-containing DNA-directed RNA polymerase subunit 2 [Cotonvirus japonicus]